MKKFVFVLLSVCLLICSAFPVFAQGEIAKLNLDYSVKDNGNIIVTAAVVDIQDSSGILILFYDVSFDSKKLEVVSSNVNMPSEWKPFEDIGMSEVIFMENQISNKYVWWSTFAGEADKGYGITDDNEFRIEIEFKTLENCETTVKFTSDSVYTDSDVYLENPQKAESKSISIKAESGVNTETEESEETSTEIEISDSESEVNSEIVSEDISEDTDINSELDDISQESNEDFSENISAENSNDDSGAGSSVESFDSSMDVESDENSQNGSSDESIDASVVDSSISNNEENNTLSDNSDDADDSDDNSNIVIIVISALVVVLVVGVVFFIIKTKKGKKQ